MERYLVVYEDDILYWVAVRNLQKQVEQLCKEGWKPQGGVCVLYESKRNWVAFQAMIK